MKNNQTEHLPDGGKMISSIDWLLDELYDLNSQIVNKEISAKEYFLKRYELFEQAKKMRMQELKHAYEAEQNNCRGIFKYESFEHYYRETFKNQEDES
jgi:hypothetical protein